MASDWETSKENIQPLRHGRKLENIQQDQKQIFEQKQQYESELRSYSGPDPLDPWYRYISWIEQTFPAGGKEGNLQTILEKCIKQFKDEEKCNQDKRYLDIWMKYANMSQKPLDIFNFMSTQNLCTALGQFYDSWAYELELMGNFKKAELVYQRGLQQPGLDDHAALDTKHKQFQARVMKHVLEEQENEEEAKEEERTALGGLRGHGKKQTVGSIRTGAAKTSSAPIRVGENQQRNAATPSFSVFKDKENSSSAFPAVGPSDNLPTRHRERENELQAGKWSQVHLGKKSHAVPFNQVGVTPAFQVHQDEESEQPKTTPHTINFSESKVLHSRKVRDEDQVTPIALFEPPDPTKMPMYCKHLVYQGGTEFSFEELRSIKWKKQYEEKKLKEEVERKMLALEELELKLAQKQEEIQKEALRREEMFKREQELARQRQQEEFEKLKSELLQSVQSVRPPSSVDSSKDSRQTTTSDAEESSGRRNLDDTNALLHIKPTEHKSNESFPRTNSDLQRTSSDLGSGNNTRSCPSPTVNTREAISIMQKMWGAEESLPERTKTKTEQPKFAVYTDDDEPVQEDDSPFEPVPERQPLLREKSTGFSIFCDENQEPPKPTKTPFAVYSDENAAPTKKPTISVYCDENDEPPRKKPSPPRRAPFAIYDDSEPMKTSEPIMPPPKVKPGIPVPRLDQTIALPSEQDFEASAKLASTPYNGRQFIPDEDEENTCAVQLAFKKPVRPNPAEAPQPAPETMEVPLSPIMESSREFHYKSSSSSSSSSCHATTFGKSSHWGNTKDNLTESNAKTPGQILSKSNAKTPGQVLSKSLKLGLVPEEKDEDEENEETGFFNDMMADFRRNISISHEPKKSSFLQQSLKASFLMDDEVSPSAEQQRPKADVTAPRLDMTAPRLDMTAPRLDMTAPRMERSRMAPEPLMDVTAPKLDVTAPRLDMTAPRLDMTAPRLDMTAPRLNRTSSGAQPEFDQTAPRLDQTAPRFDLTAHEGHQSLTDVTPPPDFSTHEDMDMEEVRRESSILEIPSDIDPFDDHLIDRFLSRLKVPIKDRHGYFRMSGPLPTIKSNRLVQIGPNQFMVLTCSGEGSYGKVFKAVKHDNSRPNETIAGIDVVLKVQKPSRDWEFYICTEIHGRLGRADASDWFLSIPRCFSYDDGSVFVSPFHPGTLLDLVNMMGRLPKTAHESLAMYFLIEMLHIAEKLQKAKIIHADIKPDNFLLQSMPSLNENAETADEMFSSLRPSLQLIDFGRCIDLSLFDEGMSFVHVFKTKDLRSPDMLEGRSWTYQLDYFGIASTTYAILFGSYMKMKETGGAYSPLCTFKRWWDTEMWTEFFHEFLNIPSCTELPDVRKWRRVVEEKFFLQKRKNFGKVVEDVASNLDF